MKNIIAILVIVALVISLVKYKASANIDPQKMWNPRSYNPTIAWETEVSRGRVPTSVPIRVLGKNPELPVGVMTDISELGVTSVPFPSTAIPMEMVSTSSQDTHTTGTGAWMAIVYGLDNDYVEQSETVALTGTTPVTLAYNYRRLNFVVIKETAPGRNFSAGNISVTSVGGTTEYIRVSAGSNISKQAVYTVSAGHTANVKACVSGVLGKEAEMQLIANHNPRSIFGTLGAWVEHDFGIYKNNTQPRNYTLQHTFPEKTDIIVRGMVTSGSAGIATTVMELYLEDI